MEGFSHLCLRSKLETFWYVVKETVESKAHVVMHTGCVLCWRDSLQELDEGMYWGPFKTEEEALEAIVSGLDI